MQTHHTSSRGRIVSHELHDTTDHTTSKSEAKISTQDSLLLQLSAELRNNIYSLALTSDEEIKVPADGRLARPALLKACTQIMQEATGLYYASNKFVLEFTPTDLSPVKLWLQTIGTKNAIVIDTLTTVLDANKEVVLSGRKQSSKINYQRKWDDTVAALLGGGVRGTSILLRHPLAIKPCSHCGDYHGGRWPRWMRTPVTDMKAAIDRAEAALA
ncbi:hypothetical protein LTR65_006799 [Meristemomyces frigidus]